MNIALLYPTRERNSTGVRNLTKGTIIETLRYDHENHYYLSDDPYFDGFGKPFSNIKWGGSEQECARYDFLCYCKDIDIIHSYWNTFESMRARCRKILTVHDLIPLIYPQWHTMYDYFNGSVRKTALMSDIILTNSEYTKSDVVNNFHIPEERVKVIYPGLLHTLDFSQRDNKIIEKYGIQDGYIMTVSTIEPRKNLRGLISGFIQYLQSHPNSHLKLLLAGDIGWDREFESDIAKLNEYKDRIVLTGFVSDKDLSMLYQYAIAVAYVSFYEGFGLPLLEALSAGKAVISSNTSSMPEVCGNAACYCDPYDVESIQYAIEKVVLDEAYRIELEERAKGQAAQFSYKKAAKETVEVYNRLGVM